MLIMHGEISIPRFEIMSKGMTFCVNYKIGVVLFEISENQCLYFTAASSIGRQALYFSI